MCDLFSFFSLAISPKYHCECKCLGHFQKHTSTFKYRGEMQHCSPAQISLKKYKVILLYSYEKLSVPDDELTAHTVVFMSYNMFGARHGVSKQSAWLAEGKKNRAELKHVDPDMPNPYLPCPSTLAGLFNIVVADEAHWCKNSATTLNKAVRWAQYDANFTLVMSATPTPTSTPISQVCYRSFTIQRTQPTSPNITRIKT